MRSEWGEKMGYLDLYTSRAATFGGTQREYADADYVVVGVPFDATSSFRPGSRFAPSAIREASLNIEEYSFRTGVDLEELKICDAGDLHVLGDLHETLRRLRLVTKEILGNNKIPVFLGGEHTITLGAVKGAGNRLAVLCFDAHLDLRNEYMGQSVCHATVMRRISEASEILKTVMVGTRAVCREELEYAEKQGIHYVTSQRIMQLGTEVTSKEINNLLSGYSKVYLSIDMDVLDPACAPAVQTPEPEGLSTSMLLEILFGTLGQQIVALDIVEATPHYDMGITAIQAAKIIGEALTYIHKDREKPRS
jgi:agmatinase